MSEEKQGSGFEAAALKIRETAKWILASFAAIGAALVAGIQFAGIGKLSGDALWYALAGASTGLFGVALAITGVGGLLLPRSWTLTELSEAPASEPARKALAGKPELLGGFKSLEELRVARDSALEAYGQALTAWRKASPANKAKAEQAATQAADDLEPTTTITRGIVEWANYLTLRADYARVQRWRLVPGLVLAFAGLVVFAMQTSAPAASAGPSLTGITVPAGAELVEVRLANANLEGSTLAGVDLTRADLHKARLSGADLRGAILKEANLAGADLEGAQLDGVVWGDTICPDGINSKDVGQTCMAHLHAPELEPRVH